MKLAFYRIIWWTAVIALLPFLLLYYLTGVLANAFINIDDKIEELKKR